MNVSLGKFANNVVTLLINSDDKTSGNPADFHVTIPNVGNYPHKTQCLLFVTDVMCANKNIDTIYDEPMVSVGLSISGLGVQNCYDTKNKQNEIVAYGQFDRPMTTAVTGSYTRLLRTSLDTDKNGVMCSAPFGKDIHVRLLDLSTLQPLRTAATNNDTKDGAQFYTHASTKTSIVLKLFMIDDKDMLDV